MKKAFLLLSTMLLFSKVALADRGRLDYEGSPFLVHVFLFLGAIVLIAIVVIMIKEGEFFKLFERKEDRNFGCLLTFGVIGIIIFLLSKCS